MKALRDRLRAARDIRHLRRLAPEDRAIVFYAEDTGSSVHLLAIVGELVRRHGRSVCYLTSDPCDPVLTEPPSGACGFFVGNGWARTYLFASIETEVMVMTMPDLEAFQLKKSRAGHVRYVYAFHSIVSTHMVYRQRAFDHFDTILCVGPHHVAEIRARERLYGLPRKELVEQGYVRLDEILASAQENPAPPAARPPGDRLRVLIAPSWDRNGLLETHGVRVVDVLVEAGFHVTIRPHPVTVTQRPDVIAAIRSRIAGLSHAVLELDVRSTESLFAADIMISDWSGVALEFAFGLGRPVVFVNVPRKVNNPEYERLEIEPLEVSIRSRIGAIIEPQELAKLPAVVRSLVERRQELKEELRRLHEETVFNVGSSAAVAAECIDRLAASSRETA